jgi:hypothetical protein
MGRIPIVEIDFTNIYADPFDEIVFGNEPFIIENECIEDVSCYSTRPWELLTPNTDESHNTIISTSVKAKQNGECSVTNKKPSPVAIKRRAPKKPVPPEIKATFSYQERRRKNNKLARLWRQFNNNPRQSRIAQKYMIEQLNSINLKLREEREALKSQLNLLLAQLE